MITLALLSFLLIVLVYAAYELFFEPPDYTTVLNTTQPGLAWPVGLVKSGGYIGVFGSVAIESASLPIPSEVVLPLTGLLAYRGSFDLALALMIVYLGSFVGIAVDYYLAYYLGKDFIYKHSAKFHINKASLESFERWFSQNGTFAVFICRMLPVVKGLVSFPAGFAQMNQKEFFFYSMIGSIVWDTALVLFGFYALSAASGMNVLLAIALFATVLYFLYARVARRFVSH